MDFKTFGNQKNPSLLLLHGLAMTWKSFDEIVPLLMDDYFLVIPVLDGHNPDNRSNFQTVQEEAEKIEKKVVDDFDRHLSGVLGFSLGGTIAIELLTRNKIQMDRVILDGACASTPGSLSRPYASMWISMLSKFTDGKNISSFLKKVTGSGDVEALYNMLFFNLSEKTITNACKAAFEYEISPYVGQSKAQVTFWHGQREPYPAKTAKKMKEYLPAMRIRIFGNLGHGELFSRFPQRYVVEIRNFLLPENQSTDALQTES